MAGCAPVSETRRWVLSIRQWSTAQFRPNLHLLFLGGAALPLVPVLHRLHLPVAWPWLLILTLTAGIVSKSIFAAALFWVIIHPGELREVARRLREHPRETALFLLGCGVLLAAFRPHTYWIADLFVIFQFAQRKWEQGESIVPGLLATALAGFYLVIAIFLAFTYNDVVASLRFYAEYDQFFQRLDMRLFGTTSSLLAHRAAALLPPQAFRFFESVYMSMFWILGATATVCALNLGLKRAMQFAGAILIAQCLAVSVYFIWPSHGPYYTCENHFARLPGMLSTYQTQWQMLRDARLVWSHARLVRLPFDYYLSFPCTHIAQPLIATWFLRRWKSLAIVMATYCVVLSITVVLLEWHYLVDLLGGIAIAVAALWIVGDLRWSAAPIVADDANLATEAAA